MKDTADKLLEKLDKVLDQLGVSTALVLVQDPDSNQLVALKRGESVWLVGAADVIRASAIEKWLDSRDRGKVDE